MEAKPRWGGAAKCSCGWSTLSGGKKTREKLFEIIQADRTNHTGDGHNFQVTLLRINGTDLTEDLISYLNPVTLDTIAAKFDIFAEKYDRHAEKTDQFRRKLTALLSRMYERQEISLDVLNRLKEVAHEWLDETIDSQDEGD